jgi:GTP cyclohydrolase-4
VKVEIHNLKPMVPVYLGRVGVVGVKMPVGFTFFKRKPVIVIPTFDIFIDLPSNQKGIHASRNYEIATDVLSRFTGKTYKLENICSDIATMLLKSHRYANRAEVKAEGEAVIEKHTPKTGMISYEPCNLTALAVAERKRNDAYSVRKMIGVSVTGITACPCAQELLRDSSRKEIIERFNLPKEVANKILRKLPLATHIQRSHGSLITEVPSGIEIDVSKLVDIVEKSMSASSYGLLKRVDEAELVKRAVRNTKFVEDCVRSMMKNFAKSFPNLPDSTIATFKQISSESIHKHNFMAERTITLRELRKTLKVNDKHAKKRSG